MAENKDLTSQLITENKELTSETLQHIQTHGTPVPPQRIWGANMNSGGRDDNYPTENIEYASLASPAGYGSSVKRSRSSFDNIASPPAHASEVQSGATPSHKRTKITGRTLFPTASATATSVGIPTGAAGGPPQIVSNSEPADVTQASSVSGGTPASFGATSVETPALAAPSLARGVLLAPGTVFGTAHGSQQVTRPTVSKQFVQAPAVPAAAVGAAHAPAAPPPFFAFGGTPRPAAPAGGGSSDEMDDESWDEMDDESSDQMDESEPWLMSQKVGQYYNRNH